MEPAKTVTRLAFTKLRESSIDFACCECDLRVMDGFDSIVVGGGHNGLVCACYMAKAGLKTAVIERRPIVGGAVCTEEIVPGYRFDVGSSAHIMFKSTGIMEELDLAGVGLEYFEMDPWAFHPVAGTNLGIEFWRDLDKTCESIARVSPTDAEAYRKFISQWGELNAGVFEVFQVPPTPGNLLGTIFRRNLTRPRSRRLWSSMDTVRQLMGSYGRLIEENFESEPMRTAMTWLAAQSGPAPDEAATGDFAGWQAMIHAHGAWRAKGGSGSLTQALAKRLESYGGQVILDAPVTKVSKGEAPWRFSVQTGKQNYGANSVVFACHVQTAVLGLLDEELTDSATQKSVRDLRVGNGFGMVVRHAVSELPQYMGITPNEKGVAPCHHSLQLLCPSRQFLRDAHHDFLAGRPPRKPAVVAMTFSSLDSTLAPEGKHVLFAWAQYHPYELSNGENWDAIAEREADKIYQTVCDYAPNMRNAMEARFIQTPLEIERRIGLPRANVMHLEMSFDQMFCFRPTPALSGYRFPTRGLYLTGASTHPGGGVFGASGRNAAGVVLADARRGRLK